MKFNETKKKEIIDYLLRKINQRDSEISKTVAENYNINQNTVHTYINELVNNNVIRRIKRGEYELVQEIATYHLDRQTGDLDSDTYAYEKYFSKHIANFSDNVKGIWAYSFTEMVNNIIDHSLSDYATLVVKQDYLSTTVILEDGGVGIFNKIKDHFHLASLDEAICELFKGKLTTDHNNHSGEGIFFTSKMMDYFYIISSEKLFTSNKYNNDSIIDTSAKPIKGTCVIMSLSNYSNKEPKEIFDLYANDEGSFTKTKIPLKNIFETSPVSRSQAKRVCNRLDKFKEIILDFDNITWIGQGFAHQLFVVFANAHPDISLIPINMNEDVTKMYNHVRG